METQEKIEMFRQIIANKYRIYNSLFLNLPYENVSHTGIYIPLLHKLSDEGYANKLTPEAIIEDFFAKHTKIRDTKAQLNMLFRMVQYIERQVLLFDCVEDAAFSNFNRQQLKQVISTNNPSHKSVTEHLANTSARLVFTAHPTQFYSSDVQTIMHTLREAISKDQISKIDALLQQLAFTPFLNRNKPTPLDEAKNIVHYLRYVYYDAFGKLYHLIAKASKSNPDFNPKLLEMGFWPGGDRDGNPFVNATITAQVANLLRTTILKCYYNHLKDIKKRITFTKVAPILSQLKDELYKHIFMQEGDFSPWYLIEKLEEVKTFLISDYQSLYLDELNDFLGRIHLFGQHFATLDIRQDSSIHRELMAVIYFKNTNTDFYKLTLSEQVSWLTTADCSLQASDFEEAVFADTITNIKQIAFIQAKNGERGLHRYIISNTESEVDILIVHALFRFCGYHLTNIKIDFVPLFETMQGMANAQSVMQALYQNPIYASHLQARGKEQTIMLGFSDGTKDGGYLKANWEINQTKERLSTQAKANQITIIYFDGRGGPPARGGGKTHQFYASQSPEITGNAIQLTIQGQTITSIYGTKEQATYNLEQLLLAGHMSKVQNNRLNDDQIVLMEKLANDSYQKYTKLKENPLFLSYLSEMTTLKYYGETNIGSRPSKRNNDIKLSLKDLRAIPFVGAWSLVRQNVPGYYGLGTAMEQFADNPAPLEDLYQQSPFFRSLIQNSIMSMKKSYFPLTAYMQNDATYGGFWLDLRHEYLLAKKWALFLTKQTVLMENEPLARQSVSMRERIILPLLTIQQYALQKIQANDAFKNSYEKLVIRSLFGNINASRNSA